MVSEQVLGGAEVLRDDEAETAVYRTANRLYLLIICVDNFPFPSSMR